MGIPVVVILLLSGNGDKSLDSIRTKYQPSIYQTSTRSSGAAFICLNFKFKNKADLLYFMILSRDWHHQKGFLYPFSVYMTPITRHKMFHLLILDPRFWQVGKETAQSWKSGISLSWPLKNRIELNFQRANLDENEIISVQLNIGHWQIWQKIIYSLCFFWTQAH